MIKAVIFDLDGTLLDREASVNIFLEKQYERLHAWVSMIEKPIFIKRFNELEKNGYVWKEEVYRQMIDEFSFSGCTTDMLVDDYTDHFQESCIPYPGLHSTLHSLRASGYKLGMITNGLEIVQSRSIRGLGIETFFDEILISAKEGCAKPDKEIFIRALNRLEVDSEEAVYIGDHAEKDIKAAQAAGMKAVWKKHSRSENVQADAEIDQLGELISILGQWKLLADPAVR
ncbi:HAD family hydrolase [Jeotgalibacillus proteolyticus]|uniref:L-2-haloalkanoic acid dehalogenase n=1 Tax=Jeotgalibacillus proteolyticus TaxID=2082395 RepID=A0A2S5GAI4_9BACL|nr:HAD-IA family hydrolase [Jeotgalibacillus proteolyticus]PPA69923.1 L-2-haloalkanoic acid dehalogenase [Jeotgalibacillus proteolyticus]